MSNSESFTPNARAGLPTRTPLVSPAPPVYGEAELIPDQGEPNQLPCGVGQG